MADNYSEMDVVMQNDSWKLCTERLLNSYRGHSKDREVHINIILSGVLFSFSFGFLLVCQFSFSFLWNVFEFSIWSIQITCTIFCHFFLMWKVQFLNIKKIYICLVFFNYISYMAISKGQIIKSRQWSEIMSRVRNEEKPQRCWFNWSNV